MFCSQVRGRNAGARGMPRQCEVPRVEGSNVLSALGEVEPPHVGRDLSDISLYQDSLRGRLQSPARDVRRSLRLLFHPGLGFLRSVTHAVCPALWARARRPTVGKPCRPAPLVPSCTSGVLPPPYLLHEEGEGGDACSLFDKRRGEKPAVASIAPTCGEKPVLL